MALPEDSAAAAAGVGEIADRLAAVRAHVSERAGDAVELVVVTKAHPVEVAAAVLDAGGVDLGESYAQELVGKLDAPELADHNPRWHFIGRLQRNKISKLAGRVHLWHSLDRTSVIDAVATRDPGAAVLLQVNFTDEPQKGGCDPADAEALVARAVDAGLQVRGLMTVGPTGPPELAAGSFGSLVTMADQLDLPVRSMGMSADLDVALDAGATMVRVGSSVVGPRPPRS
jgi:pyridoxal phosphate enzyme (YggS family)